MNKSVPVDTELVQHQWKTLKSTIETAGGQVEVLEPEVGCLGGHLQ